MPTKSEWERQLKRVYEGEASIEEVADKLGVEKAAVSQRYDRFLNDLLEERERELDQLEREVGEKERKIRSLSEGIERTDEKLKETEEKLPRMTKLDEMVSEWERKIQRFADTWRTAKRRVKSILVLVGILILVLGVGSYFLFGQSGQSAKFTAENLETGSKKAFVGESKTFSFDIMNVGGSVGTFEAELEFNGEVVKSKKVALKQGESQNISITGTVVENGPIRVSIDGLEDNFVAFKPFPFEGAYADYETRGVVASVGGTSGSEIYRVTNVSNDKYTQKLVPKKGLTTIDEVQEYITSKGTPLSVKDKEWENFSFVGSTTQETEFGDMELLHYLREAEMEGGTESWHVYLEENTRIPVYFKFEAPFGFIIGKLVDTNVNYLKAK